MAWLGEMIFRGAGATARGGYKFGRTALLGGAGGRMLTGAAIGGVVGTFRGDVTGTRRFESVLRHAALGAITGGAVSAIRPMVSAGMRANQAIGRRALAGEVSGVIGPGQFAKYARNPEFAKQFAGAHLAQFARSPLAGVGRMAGRAGLGAGGLGYRAGRFAFEHPLATGAMVGGAVLAGGMGGEGEQSFESPTLGGVDMNVDYNRQTIAAHELMGDAYSPMGGVMAAPQFMQMQERRRMQQSTEGLVQGLHRSRHK